MRKINESGHNGQKLGNQSGVAVIAVSSVAEKTRYSSEELEEFKQIILRKIERAKEDLVLLKTLHSNKNGTDDTYHQVKVLEQGQETISKIENFRDTARQEKFIQDLEGALFRIGNGTYGICRKTGKLISRERLIAVPHATLSIAAKNSRELETPINGRQLAIGKRHQ